MVRKIPHPWSDIAVAKLGFLTRFLTAKFSTQITWFSYAILRDSLCKKSSLTLATLLDTLATKSLALRRLLDVLSVFWANFFCLRFLFLSNLANRFLGRSYFEPSEVIAKIFNPKSTPIAPLIGTTGVR